MRCYLQCKLNRIIKLDNYLFMLYFFNIFLQESNLRKTSPIAIASEIIISSELTDTEIAEVTWFSVQNVNRWRNAKVRRINTEYLEILADELGATLSYDQNGYIVGIKRFRTINDPAFQLGTRACVKALALHGSISALSRESGISPVILKKFLFPDWDSEGFSIEFVTRLCDMVGATVSFDNQGELVEVSEGAIGKVGHALVYDYDSLKDPGLSILLSSEEYSANLISDFEAKYLALLALSKRTNGTTKQWMTLLDSIRELEYNSAEEAEDGNN